jgi:type I restriction enzyme M protein
MAYRTAKISKATQTTSKRRDVLVTLLRHKYLFGEETFASRTVFLEPSDLSQPVPLCGFTFQTPNGAPFLLGVVALESDKEQATKNAFQYALSSETLGLVVVSLPEQETPKFFRRHFNQPKFDEISEIEYYCKGALGPQGALLEDSPPYRTKAKELVQQPLLPISNKLENIFFELHSCMRDIDGLHADAALEELCKLLYVKIYDEELLEREDHETMHTKRFGCCEEYAASIRQLYREAIEYDLRVFRLKIPQYERSRGVFNQPIKLSSAALTRAFQLLENFSLSKSRSDVKGRAFQQVLGRAVRAGMGQYFTPAELCEMMVGIVQPHASQLILDPFCGSGHFLSESLRFVGQTSPTSGKQFHEFAFGKLHGIEKSDRMTRIAMTDMRLNGDGHSNIRCTDALLDFANYPDISPESFDVVLTNPPFGSLLGPEAIAALGRFELAQGRRNVPLEVLGLERAIQFLRPGGRLGIVLPDNVLSADSYEYVREWLRKKVCVRVILGLPVETFSPFGANVKTSILFARKWRSGETPNESAKVCLQKIEAVGYDASGRLTNKSDIPEAISTACAFLKNNGW